MTTKQDAMERARELFHNVCDQNHSSGLPKLKVDCKQCVASALLAFRKEGLEELRQEVLDTMTVVVLECIHDKIKEVPVVQKRISEGLAHAIGKMDTTKIL